MPWSKEDFDDAEKLTLKLDPKQIDRLERIINNKTAQSEWVANLTERLKREIALGNDITGMLDDLPKQLGKTLSGSIAGYLKSMLPFG